MKGNITTEKTVEVLGQPKGEPVTYVLDEKTQIRSIETPDGRKPALQAPKLGDEMFMPGEELPRRYNEQGIWEKPKPGRKKQTI